MRCGRDRVDPSPKRTEEAPICGSVCRRPRRARWLNSYGDRVSFTRKKCVDYVAVSSVDSMCQPPFILYRSVYCSPTLKTGNHSMMSRHSAYIPRTQLVLGSLRTHCHPCVLCTTGTSVSTASPRLARTSSPYNIGSTNTQTEENSCSEQYQ